eukprot:COSAG02_NODE_1087_length_14672_cov_189.858437_11_plen_127_part_00
MEAIQQRMSQMPRFLQMSLQHVCSVRHGVKPEILSLVPKFNGTGAPSLREWVDGMLEALLHIPSSADDAGLKPFLMYVSMEGQAKDVLRLENQRLVGEGKTELHARADDGNAIMDLSRNRPSVICF